MRNVETTFVTTRGEYRVNKILLQYPEISCSKSSSDKHQNLNNMGINNSINTKETLSSSYKDTISKVEFENINFNTGYAEDAIQTILKKAQRNEQTLPNIEESKEKGFNFCAVLQV